MKSTSVFKHQCLGNFVDFKKDFGMQKMFRFVVATLTLATLCSFSGVGNAAQDVVFGQVASQTNPASAANAKGLVVGIQTYFAKINASGGIAGQQAQAGDA
ncbi:hypothetical protein LP416_22095 [Polaromonas sp. P2-4]|nr:hypothetical protein LP416_22095 [Polaromonas sp. P2-4]